MEYYRIVISAVSRAEESGLETGFVARAPELPECVAEGATRAEAVAALEKEVAARLSDMEREGVAAPPSLDLAELGGELQVKVTPWLHRELLLLAKEAGVDLAVLLTEVLTRGVAQLVDARVRPQRGGGPRRGASGRRGRGMDDQHYHNIMDDRASFIEYVRQLERDGRGSPGGGRGGRGGGRGRR
jgi:predicted RNase H-like HicB family nuclease